MELGDVGFDEDAPEDGDGTDDDWPTCGGVGSTGCTAGGVSEGWTVYDGAAAEKFAHAASATANAAANTKRAARSRARRYAPEDVRGTGP